MQNNSNQYLVGFLEQEELTKFTCPLAVNFFLSNFLMFFEYKAKSSFHLL